MKTLITLLITLFSANVFADRIACTTRFLNMKADGKPDVKVCGEVTLEKTGDNGVKYRRNPRFCDKFVVEFLSIRQGDEARFTGYCDKIFAKNCYVVRIHDDGKREGLQNLSSHVVFSSIKTMPAIFNLTASGLGLHTGRFPGHGRIVRMDLSCRKTP